jgi:hypothetical protein
MRERGRMMAVSMRVRQQREELVKGPAVERKQQIQALGQGLVRRDGEARERGE